MKLISPQLKPDIPHRQIYLTVPFAYQIIRPRCLRGLQLWLRVQAPRSMDNASAQFNARSSGAPTSPASMAACACTCAHPAKTVHGHRHGSNYCTNLPWSEYRATGTHLPPLPQTRRKHPPPPGHSPVSSPTLQCKVLRCLPAPPLLPAPQIFTFVLLITQPRQCRSLMR